MLILTRFISNGTVCFQHYSEEAKNKIQKMVTSSETCSRLLTHHRSVAHIVEGIGVIFLVFFIGYVGFGYRDFTFVGYLISGIIECVKGILLLVAIFKQSPKHIFVYLVINILTVLIKHGLIIYLTVSAVVDRDHTERSILSVSFVVLYIIYEWFMVYAVIKHRQSVQSQDEKEVHFHYEQQKGESVDIIG